MRAFRLGGLPEGVKFFEIDNADVLTWKEHGVARCEERYPGAGYTTPRYPLKRIGANLRDEGTYTLVHSYTHARARKDTRIHDNTQTKYKRAQI
jgi:hypothetical protein